MKFHKQKDKNEQLLLKILFLKMALKKSKFLSGKWKEKIARR